MAAVAGMGSGIAIGAEGIPNGSAEGGRPPDAQHIAQPPETPTYVPPFGGAATECVSNRI